MPYERLAAVDDRTTRGARGADECRLALAVGQFDDRLSGVRLDQQGALLVADDVGNTVWRVTPAAKSAAR